MPRVLAVLAIAVVFTACASAPSTRGQVVRSAPSVAEFTFNASPPISAAADYAPWAAVDAANTAEQALLDACLAERDACANGHLLRYRSLLEVAADLPEREQLTLVHEYFNSIDQTLNGAAPDSSVWPSLYRIASTHAGDCKAIAFGKYFTLRRLGWPVNDLRVVMEWDDLERDWHALLAARDNGETFMLDSILGLQKPQAFGFGYMVYSISETGVWDHAPGFVPVP